jgi:hypothetical protein
MPKNPGQIHEFQVPCANKRHAPDHQTSKAKKAQLLTQVSCPMLTLESLEALGGVADACRFGAKWGLSIFLIVVAVLYFCA